MKSRANTCVVTVPLFLAAALCPAATWAEPALSAPHSAPVAVTLVVEKRVLPAGKGSHPLWQPLNPGNATVLPGDVLRYTVSGHNSLVRPIKGLVLNLAIPHGSQYQPLSAAASEGADMTISLDGGKTFTEQPVVKVTHSDGTITAEPAPVSRYTALRWKFGNDLPAFGTDAAHCEVRVQ